MSTQKPTPKKSPESIVQGTKSAPDALIHLRDEMEKQNLSVQELRELRAAMEKSDVKEKRALTEEIEKKMRIKEAEEALAGLDDADDSGKKSPLSLPKIFRKTKGGLIGTVGDVVNDYSIKASEFVLGDRTNGWSDQKKRNVGLAITLGTVAAVATVAWLVTRGKESAEVGREAAQKSGGGFFKKLLIGLGIGAAVFLGYKGYKMYGQYKEKMQTLDDLQKQLRDARDAATLSGGKAREEWEAKEKELQEQIEEAKKRLKEGADGNKDRPEVGQALEAARKTARTMTAAGLVLTHKKLATEAGIITENTNETEKVMEALSNEDVRKLPIEKILSVRTADQAAALLPNSDRTQAQKNGILFLILVAQEAWKSKRMRTFVSGKGEEADPKTTNMGQLLDMTSVVPNFFGQVGGALEGQSFEKMLDIRTVLGKAMGPDTMLHQFVDHPVIKEKLLELEPALKTKEAQFAFFCLVQKDKLTLKTVLEAEPANEDEKIFLRALTKIRTELLRPESQNYLQLYAHGDDSYKNILARQLSGDLNVQDAAQLYAYLQLAKDPKKKDQFPASLKESSGTGAMLVQMKVLNIVSKVNKGEGIRMRDMLILRSPNADFDVPDEMRDMIAKLGTIGAEIAGNKLWEGFMIAARETSTFVTEAHRIHPKISVGVDAGIAGTLGYLGYRWFGRDISRHMKDVLQNKKKGAEILSWAHPTEAGRNYYSIGKTTELSGKISNIETTIGKVTDPLLKQRLAKSFANLHKRGYLPSSFETFYREAAALKTAGADPALIDDILSEAQILQKDWRVLQRHRFFFARRWMKSGAETVKGAVNEFKTFDALRRAIDAARKSKNAARLMELLKNPMVLRAARAGDKTARALWSVARVTGKYGNKLLPVLGTLIDAAFIYANESEIAEAKKTNNTELVATLESKRINLGVGGAANLAMLGLAPSATAIAAPLVVAAQVYSSAVYDSIIEWQRSPYDWMQKSPEELRAEMVKRKVGYTDWGMRAGVGYNGAYAGWRWARSWTKEGQKTNDREDEEQYRATESINQNIRQELLSAYFLKTQLDKQYEGESLDDYKKRVTPLLRDRLNYIKHETSGTFDAHMMTERQLAFAGNYADLMVYKREQQEHKQPLELEYEYDGKQRTIDLSVLDLSQEKTKGNDMKLTKTLQQYETEVKPMMEAMKELREMESEPLPLEAA